MSGEKAAPLIKRYVIQVNPGRPRLGIDLTLCPKSVIPDARNQKIEFTAKIYAFKNGKWVYPGEKRKITFSFMEVSKERGVCMNYPIKDRNNITPAPAIASNTNPDLFFPEDDDKMKDFDFDEDETDGDADKKCPTEILVAGDNPAHSHHYKKTTTKKAVTEAKVIVRCEDYGAFGILKAEADNCETLKPRERDAGCSKNLGKNDVRIPRDCNKPDRNYIADSAKSWDNVSLDKYKDGSNAPADDDEDSSPGNNNKGDGLTNYEEYRGFIVKVGANKIHRRTNINKKDVFIYDGDNLGTVYFTTSGLIIHLLQGPEYYNGNSKVKGNGDHVPDPSDSQCLNCNRTSHTGGDQHCLRIVKEPMAPDDEGYTYGKADVPLLPKEVHYVAINADALNTAAALNCTVAHELGHAVYVQHHGDSGWCGDCLARVPKEYYDQSGSLTSGNVTCLMRYNDYGWGWCHKVGGACDNHARSNPDHPGNTFCTSAIGTGCNVIAGHFRNDASRGNCKGQIKVKDW
jgi:hypothetical protein